VHLIRSLLEVYSSSTPKAEIESTFAKLEGLGPLSVEVLRETMIGRTPSRGVSAVRCFNNVHEPFLPHGVVAFVVQLELRQLR